MRPEESLRHHRDFLVLPAAVGVASGGDYDRVEEVVAEFFGEPVQVLDLPGSEGLAEFDLDGYDLAVVALDDEVDLVPASLARRCPTLASAAWA